jgi:hypothetical protein
MTLGNNIKRSSQVPIIVGAFLGCLVALAIAVVLVRRSWRRFRSSKAGDAENTGQSTQ